MKESKYLSKIYQNLSALALICLLSTFFYSCQKEYSSPSILLKGLSSGQEIEVGSKILIYAKASDFDGHVVSISLLINDELVYRVNSDTLNYLWEVKGVYGSYCQISIIASNNHENVSEETLFISIIQPSKIPIARFIAHHTYITPETNIHFFDKSEYDPTAWTWNFDDGNISREKNPIHRYINPGMYSVSLTVSNLVGSDTLLKENYIVVSVENDSSVKDYDGHIYKTVKIGNQIWLAENLKSTFYSDGSPVVNGADVGSIGWDTTSQYYFSYDNDNINISAYGRLYTWPAAMNSSRTSNKIPSGVQGICPSGWHLPSDREWMQLEMFLGMSIEEVQKIEMRGINEGGKLKVRGTDYWRAPNSEATDEYGFSAYPGGDRFWSGNYHHKEEQASFWTSTEFNYITSWRRILKSEHGGISRNFFHRKSVGLSVRCVKD